MRSSTRFGVLFLLYFASPILYGCNSAGPAPSERPEALGIVPVLSTVRLGPVWGLPKDAAGRLVQIMDAEAAKSRLALLNYEGAASDCLIRGDIGIMIYRKQIRMTYNWYVLNRDGKVIGRKSGIEITDAVTGSAESKDIPESSLQAIAAQGIAAILTRG